MFLDRNSLPRCRVGMAKIRPGWRSLTAPYAEPVPFRWRRGGLRCGQKFVPVAWCFGYPGVGQKLLLVVQDARGHAIGYAEKPTFITRHFADRGKKVVPVEIRMPRPSSSNFS